MATGSLDGSVKIWDTRKGGARSLLASFDWRQEQDINYDVNKWQRDFTIDETVRAHEGGVMSMKFTACGRYLVTSGFSSLSQCVFIYMNTLTHTPKYINTFHYAKVTIGVFEFGRQRHFILVN